MERYRIEERGESLMIRFYITPNKMVSSTLERFGYTTYATKRVWFGKGHRPELEKLLDSWDKQCERKTVAADRKQTLCWECSKSGYGNNSECSWEREFVPVNGWTAERHEKQLYKTDSGQVYYSESYMVLECPLFEKEKR